MTQSHGEDASWRWKEESSQDLPPELPMSSDLVAAHVDIDGMVAAAGLLRTLPDDTALRFTSYRLLPGYLARLAACSDAPRRVWVADLGIDAADAAETLVTIDALRARGSRFYWFDHHRWDPDVASMVEQRCEAFHVVPGIARPAALVVIDVVHPGEPFARLAREILLERGRTHDARAWAWFRCLACLMVERDWPSMHRAVRRLSRLEELHKDDLDRIDCLPTSDEAMLMSDLMKVDITARGTRYAIIDLRAEHVRRAALAEVCRKQDLDMVVTIPSNFELVVDGLGPRADLARLEALERLDLVTHVCPHLNPVCIELDGRKTDHHHDRAVETVVGWIRQEM